MGDRKREHEAKAAEFVRAREYRQAFFHTAKAAEYGLSLAERSDGSICERYIEDAFELIEIAAELSIRAGSLADEPQQGSLRERVGSEEAAATEWELQEKPAVRLADVAGLKEVKEELSAKVIGPFQNPEAYERFGISAGGGILMYGPPGTGKTFVAKAIAGELDAAFFYVQSPQIKSKYVGETEKNLKRLFDAADTHTRSVLFFDEVEDLLSRRGNQKIGSVTTFLSLSDGVVERQNCLLLLAATNRPWMLDEATIRSGRLGTHIYVGPPDVGAREAILAFNMRGIPFDPGVSFTAIASGLDGYSGADIAELCSRAKFLALRRQLESRRDESVTSTDFEEAASRVKPSITSATLSAFDEWRTSRGIPRGEDCGDDQG